MKTSKIIRNGFKKTIAWMLGGMMTLLSVAGLASSPAYDKGNTPFGTNGHAEFAWYVQPTAIEDVYKVSLNMDIYVKPEPAEIVLVLDNSGSMGFPYDLSYGVWEGASQFTYPVPEESYTDWNGVVRKFPSATPTTYTTIPSVYGGGTYPYPTNFIAHCYPDTTWGPNPYFDIPHGAYKEGAKGNWLTKQNIEEDTLGRAVTPVDTPHNREFLTEKYRLEWVREATMEVLDMLLTEERNPLNYDQLKISIVAFGGAYSQTNAKRNPLYAIDDPVNGWSYQAGAGAGGYGDRAGVFGGGPLDTGLTSGTLTIPDYKQAITYSSGWITNKNVKTKSDEFFHSYIRRQENTYVAAGLEEAMKQFDDLVPEKWAPDNRHVFLLADGGDNSTADVANPNDPQYFQRYYNSVPIHRDELVDPTRTLAAAGALKNPNNYGAKFTTVGVLDAQEHNASAVSNTAYWNVSGAGFAGSIPAAKANAAYPETNLILLSTPLTAKAKQFAAGSGYYGSGIDATGGTTGLLAADTFANHMLLDGNTTAQGRFTANPHTGGIPGEGYKLFAEDIITNREAGYAGGNYYYAADENDVQKAFKAFASKFTNSAKDVSIEQTLTSHFDIYKMPNEPLYVTSDGSTAKISGKNINWDISTLSAKGGSVTLSYYVKFDRTGIDPSLSYPIANFTNVYWKALGTIESSTQFSIPYISGTSNVNGWSGSTGNVMTPVGSNTSGNSTIKTDGSSSFTETSGISLSNTTNGSASSNIGAMGPALQSYTASVANPNDGKKKKTTKTTVESTEEKIDETEFAKVKGKLLQVNVAKAGVFEKPDPNSKVLLYLAKGKKFKINGATKSFYQISYKTKNGKTTTGYVKKNDVKVVS